MFNIVKQTSALPRNKKRIAYHEVFATSGGKILLKNLMITCGLYRVGISGDPLANAYNEGRRSVVIDILKVLNLTEEEVSQKVNELNEEF